MATETTTSETYAVIPAPGYHGDWVTVYATFSTAAKALAYAKQGGCRVLQGCEHAKGDKISRGIVQDMISRGDWKVV